MREKKCNFLMLNKFINTEKVKDWAVDQNKLVLIAEHQISKFALIALFEEIGCEIERVNSMIYKSEKRLFRGRIGFTKKYKKFIISFAKSVNAANLIKDLADEKLSIVK